MRPHELHHMTADTECLLSDKYAWKCNNEWLYAIRLCSKDPGAPQEVIGNREFARCDDRSGPVQPFTQYSAECASVCGVCTVVQTLLKVQEGTIWLFWFTPWWIRCFAAEELNSFSWGTPAASRVKGFWSVPPFTSHTAGHCKPHALYPPSHTKQSFPCWRNYPPVIPPAF